MSRASEELEDAGLDPDEAAAVAGSASIAEPAGRDPRLCVTYLHTVHPDTGNEVVFVPGEALPDWAVKVQNEAQAERLNSTAGTKLDVSASGKRAVTAAESKQEPKDRR